MKTITETIGGAQALLDIPFDIQTCFEEKLNNEQKTFLHILRVVAEHLPEVRRPYAGTGRIPYQYLPFIKSELAKRFFQIDKTTKLIERLKADPNLRLLCGFDKVPGKSTFSRAFNCVSRGNSVPEAFDRLVKAAFSGRFVCNINRDSTAIAGRETVKKEEKTEKPHKKRGRPAKNTPKTPKQPSVMEQQITQDASVSLAALNKNCAWGCKKNSQGNVSFWKGYKLHLDVTDGGFPVTACVSGANVHDSMLAIPMEKLTMSRLTHFYSLMDSAYEAKTIIAFITSNNRVPVIDPNKRKNNARPPLDPAKKERYKIRSAVERANSHLKDSLLPKAIYVKGYAKVSYVLLSAVLCLAALKYLQLFS